MQCEAYGIVDAAKIVAACCNSEIWDSYDLIAKAVANKRFADMWLFFSLHVYSAWRSTDYVRLPAPRLRYSPQETLERIQTNNYPLEAAKYAQIPETTRIYLQDANFAGLTAAEAARLMFERGTCSFFVAKLFEMCYGEQYTRLPEFKKTEVIKFLKVTPYKSKRVLECIHNAEDEVAEIIQTMVQEGNDPKTMLERILSCSARGKGTDENCIWKACNSRCREPERIRCFGCRYEVKSKQMLVKLMAEMAKLEYADGDSLEREKNQWLQSNVIYPAAAEIIQELRKMTSDEDISDYLEICMEVKKEYGCSDQEAV